MENSIVGLIMGSIFGACLVLSGLADPDKIIGSLRLKDFYAIRTIIVFLLVGIIGTWILESLSVANLHIKPAATLTVCIGGALVGIGLGLTGYCPGTGLACAASGKIDALITVIGMLFGAHAFILIYPSIIMPLEKIADFGPVTLPQITNTSKLSWIIPIFTIGLVALFLTRPKKSKESEQGEQTRDYRTNGNLFYSKGSIPVPAGNDDIKNDFVRAIRIIYPLKNFLFIVLVLCLLILQAFFWLVNNGTIDPSQQITAYDVSQQDQSVHLITAKLAEPSQPSSSTGQGPQNPQGIPKSSDIEITFEHIRPVINIANVILILASLLYAFSIYCCLAASFAGMPRGLRHISYAGLYSLMVFVLLLPWQYVTSSIVFGSIYTPRELAAWCMSGHTDTFDTALLYLRFSGYASLIFILLILAQLRSSLWWSKATLAKPARKG
jgi:hypothetical protein